MDIRLQEVSKKYGTQRIIHPLNWTIHSGERWGIFGPNGSGKSTLIKLIYGSHVPTTGVIQYQIKGTAVEPSYVPRISSLAAPYWELIEELALVEFLQFYEAFRAWRPPITSEMLLELMYLEEHGDKPIGLLSSGMKQRLRLGLALLTAGELVLLDEPTANLDAKGILWFQQLLKENLGHRTLIVASNSRDEELFYCEHTLNICESAADSA